MLFFLADENTGPVITSFTPLSGAVGTELRIFGTGLGGQTGAAVGGVVLTGFTVVSNTEVRGTIAAGTTGGPVTVGTASGLVDFAISSGSGNAWTVGYGLELVGNTLNSILHKLFSPWERNQRVIPATFADAATVALNLQTSQHFHGTLSQDTTFSWTNLQSGMSWQVQITATATRTITWPAGIQWRGAQPTVGTGVTLIQFTTLDGTTVWGG